MYCPDTLTYRVMRNVLPRQHRNVVSAPGVRSPADTEHSTDRPGKKAHPGKRGEKRD
jgi:hypothetical protein